MSIAAAGSSARTVIKVPMSTDFRCFLSLSTGRGHKRPVASKISFFMLVVIAFFSNSSI